ncbi:MAG: hypothetical protein HY537_00750 [Deltaproteobacteria bacterium]|nr:hypothetical protein [Deltaproteobacteria bacterium]
MYTLRRNAALSLFLSALLVCLTATAGDDETNSTSSTSTSETSSSPDASTLPPYLSTLSNISNNYKPQENDRSNNADAGQIMSMIGKGIALIMCLRDKQKAADAEARGDSQAASNYNLAAAMECAQAAQDSQSGDKNKEASQATKDSDSPKMAEVKPNNQNQPKELSEPKKLAEPKRLQLPQPLASMPLAKSDSEHKDEPLAPSAEITTKSTAAQEPGTSGYAVAEALPNQNYTFKEKDLSNADEFNPVRPSGGLVGGGTGRALAQEDSGKSTKEDGSSDQERTRRRFSEGGSGGDSGGSSGSGGRSGGGGGGGGSGSEFDSLLGSLMGGNPGESARPSDVLSLSKFRADANKSGPNIFDFASLRYHSAAQEGRIKRSALKAANKTQLAKAP